jgi:uncharacterized OB-fold protein
MTTQKKQVSIAEHVFTWPSSNPRLLGSRCKTCGSVKFPQVTTCNNPECNGREIEVIELSKRGKLHSFTTMYYQPPPPWCGPESMLPYGMGWVELPEKVAVLSVLTTADLNVLKHGMDVELVIEKLYEDEDGNDVMSYKFKPV